MMNVCECVPRRPGLSWALLLTTATLSRILPAQAFTLDCNRPNIDQGQKSQVHVHFSDPTKSSTTQNDRQDDLNLESVESMKQTKILSNKRNLKLERVLNMRDLEACNNSSIKPGKLYRTGRLGDASEKDVQFLMENLQLKTLIDLRSPTELKEDPTLMRLDVYGNFTNVLWKDRGKNKDGCVRVLRSGEFPIKIRFWKRADKKNQDLVDDMIAGNYLEKERDDCEDCESLGAILASNFNYGGQRRERIFVPLMNEFNFFKGTVSKLRKRDILRAVLGSPGSIFSRRVRNSIKKPFLKEINSGGLQMLNALLFRYGAPGIKFVLEVCADEKRHPVAFYCTAGKDRTGVVAAIILALCGVNIDDIVEDYSLSANVYAEMGDNNAMVGALSRRSLDPKVFLGAPPEVMRDTLIAIEEHYGSVEAYCDCIGFGVDKQQQLRNVLLK